MIDWGQLNDRLEHGKQQRRRRRRRLPVNHDDNTKNIIITSKDTKKSPYLVKQWEAMPYIPSRQNKYNDKLGKESKKENVVILKLCDLKIQNGREIEM